MTGFMMLILGVALGLGLVWARGRFADFPAQRARDYAATTPVFDPALHLSGPILCEGVIYGPMGRVVSRFVARFEGEWQGDRGVLREHFRYDSGREQHREWQLVRQGRSGLTGTAADLVGPARGQMRGAALVLSYRIRLEPDAGGHVLDVTDWMYLLENGTIMNRSQFRKFGLKVGELVATMRPLGVA